jgi:hypothetical protein
MSLSAVVEGKTMTCIDQVHTFTIHFNPYRIPSIHGLFARCRPSTIFRTVVFTVVYSIYRMTAGWLEPHILDKILKSCPPLANGNALAGIRGGIMPAWVAAPSMHTHPTSVLAASPPATTMPVCSAELQRPFFLEAATATYLRFCIFSCKVFGVHSFFGPTVTPAQPLPRYSSEDNQSPKPLPDPINKLWHDNINVSYFYGRFKCPLCKRELQKHFVLEQWVCACGWRGGAPRMDQETFTCDSLLKKP